MDAVILTFTVMGGCRFSLQELVLPGAVRR
jgi:hypothetical protein